MLQLVDAKPSGSNHWGLVYTIDHEARPCKMDIFSWSDLMVQLLWSNFFQKKPYNLWVPHVTVCGVRGHTLSIGFHPSRFGWINLSCGEGGSSSLAWHSCQVKSCELVCGENLCEVKIACFCNKSWVILPFLTLLDSSVVEWEIVWLIMCIWRENYSSCKSLTLFLLTWQEFRAKFNNLSTVWSSMFYVWREIRSGYYALVWSVSTWLAHGMLEATLDFPIIWTVELSSLSRIFSAWCFHQSYPMIMCGFHHFVHVQIKNEELWFRVAIKY
jgi:hypothetical protein